MHRRDHGRAATRGLSLGTPSPPTVRQQREKQRDQLQAALGAAGLSYLPRGRVVGSGITSTTKQIYELVRDGDFASIEAEFKRLADTPAEGNPRETLSAAANIFEVTFGEIIEVLELTRPSDQTLRSLWRPIKKALNLDPNTIPDTDLKVVVGAMAAMTEGIPGLRDDKSFTHAMRPELARNYRIQPRHARLAVNAAYMLAIFLLETLGAKRAG